MSNVTLCITWTDSNRGETHGPINSELAAQVVADFVNPDVEFLTWETQVRRATARYDGPIVNKVCIYRCDEIMGIAVESPVQRA